MTQTTITTIGYKKLTNPKLEKQKMMNFSNVSSCGTSTAYSVPCMFSLLGKDDYSLFTEEGIFFGIFNA
jgi:glucan phosphoethanolaminetransferase (alkaline phosphatase superfamily)